MRLVRKCKKENGKNKAGIKIITGFCIAFFMAVTCHLSSNAAYQRPNNKSEIEPNDTRETAQITQPTNEVVERFAADDWSGRYSMYGKATSSDDDWYKVDLPAGPQYLSVVHSYGDNATYVELLDAENNKIIPAKYGMGYHVVQFNSEGGTYYIHIVGASEKENEYTLFVGTPMLSSDQVRISFDPVRKTYNTIKKSFSLVNEDILPKEAYVAKISIEGLIDLDYSSVCLSSSSSSNSITLTRKDSFLSTASLGMSLKSVWNAEFNPSASVTTVPVIKFLYFYPVYDNTKYPPFSTIKK